jgi:hypothetical protein
MSARILEQFRQEAYWPELRNCRYDPTHHLTIPGLPMAHIELPRALEDYFAFAETAPTRNGRRFVLTLPYFCGSGAAQKLDRLQWWFHLSPEQERQLGEAAIATLRAQATEKFHRHIERWLENTRQHIYGEEPIPRIDALDAPLAAAHAPAPETAAVPDPAVESEPAPPAKTVVPWPTERVVNG